MGAELQLSCCSWELKVLRHVDGENTVRECQKVGSLVPCPRGLRFVPSVSLRVFRSKRGRFDTDALLLEIRSQED